MQIIAANVKSDNKLVLGSMKFRLKAIKKVPRTKIYEVDKLKETDFRKEYKEDMWKKITYLVKEEMNIEATWNSVKNGIMRIAEQVLGYKTKMKKARWITVEVLQLSEMHRKLKENKMDERVRGEHNRLTKELKQKTKRE